MAERRESDVRSVLLEPVFDRLLPAKLAQVYAILVAERVRIVGAGPRLREGSDDVRGDLCPGVLRPAEGE